jgi:excisionase family DNA binding protein
MESSHKTLLTVPEAARLLRCSPSSLYEWCRQRKVEHVRLGDRVLIDPASVVRQARIPVGGETNVDRP